MTKAGDRSRRMKAMFSERPSESLESQSLPRHPSAGAIRSLESSLSRIEEENEALRRVVKEGLNVVELDPTAIEASFVQDRLLAIDVDRSFNDLVESIRVNGQLVPILVRMHPEKPEHYQIAYGHRRWKACSALEQPVKAILTDLNDEQMVIALGKENSERQDLTFIEQALFALSLKERNYRREVIAAALSIPPTNVSKITTLAQAIPRVVINVIGSAPKIGRPRWEALARTISEVGEQTVSQKLEEIAVTSEWAALTSDRRFIKFAALFSERATHKGTSIFSGPNVSISHAERGGSEMFQVSGPYSADVAAHLKTELPAIVASFLKRNTGRTSE